MHGGNPLFTRQIEGQWTKTVLDRSDRPTIDPDVLDRQTSGLSNLFQMREARCTTSMQSRFLRRPTIRVPLHYALDQKAPEELESLFAGPLAGASFACLSLRASLAFLLFAALALRALSTLYDRCSAGGGGALFCCTGGGNISIPTPIAGPILNCAAAGAPSQGAAIVKIKPPSASGNPE